MVFRNEHRRKRKKKERNKNLYYALPGFLFADLFILPKIKVLYMYI